MAIVCRNDTGGWDVVTDTVVYHFGSGDDEYRKAVKLADKLST